MPARRLITAATLIGLAVLFVVMAVWGFLAATAPLPDRAKSAEPSCSTSELAVKRTLARREVKVSVFNAGARKGQATATLAKLEARGFVAGESANAPAGDSVPFAEVWTADANDPAARLVALNLGPRAKVVVTSQDLGPGVDVLVGKHFRRLARKAPTTVPLPKPETSCVKVD